MPGGLRLRLVAVPRTLGGSSRADPRREDGGRLVFAAVRLLPPSVLLALALLPPVAAAQLDHAPRAERIAAADAAGLPSTRAFSYSAYEEATIAAALAELGLSRAAAPEGRTVEAVEVVRLEVVEARDPAPRFLNVFHVVSRDQVVRREVLLRPGDVYRQTLADESRRLLAALPQLSLVLVVAAEGSAGGVRLVVVTKDVWSLRLNWDLALTSGGSSGSR